MVWVLGNLNSTCYGLYDENGIVGRIFGVVVWFWRLKKGMIVVVWGLMIWWGRWSGSGSLGLTRGKGGKWEFMKVVLFCLAMILKISIHYSRLHLPSITINEITCSCSYFLY